MKKTAILSATIILLSACVQDNLGRTSLYRDISGQDRGDGQLTMAQARCRNIVNSYAPSDDSTSGVYASSNTGRALNSAIGSVGRSMSGPNYNDCMLSQGFQFAGYE